MITLLAQRYTFVVRPHPPTHPPIRSLPHLPIPKSSSFEPPHSPPSIKPPTHPPIHKHPPPPPKKQEEPSFKLKLKSGITLVSSNGVKVRVIRDEDYAKAAPA